MRDASADPDGGCCSGLGISVLLDDLEAGFAESSPSHEAPKTCEALQAPMADLNASDSDFFAELCRELEDEKQGKNVEAHIPERMVRDQPTPQRSARSGTRGGERGQGEPRCERHCASRRGVTFAKEPSFTATLKKHTAARPILREAGQQLQNTLISNKIEGPVRH